MSEQERFVKQFEDKYKKTDPVGAYTAQQTNLPDEVPSLKWLHNFLCIAFLFAYPIGFGYKYIVFAANLVGFLRKGGWPKWTAIYLRNACFTEEFTNLTYFLSICLVPASLFTYTPILINITLFVAIQFRNILIDNPTAAILSLALVQKQIQRASEFEF